MKHDKNVKILIFIILLCINFGCLKYKINMLVSTYEDIPISVEILTIKKHKVKGNDVDKYNSSVITIVKGNLKIINKSSGLKNYNLKDIYLSVNGNISRSCEIDSVIDYLDKGKISPGASVVFPVYWIFENNLKYEEGIELEIFIFKGFELNTKNELGNG